MNAKVMEFPSAEVRKEARIEKLVQKTLRLNELRRRHLELMDLCDEIYEEAMEITGETERNGHTQDFLNSAGDKDAIDLLMDIERNPSHLWLQIDGTDLSVDRGEVSH